MKLITDAQAKAILRITSNEYDTFLGVIIPELQKEMVAYTNNFFQDKIGLHFNSNVEFVNKTSAPLANAYIDSDHEFKYFRPNNPIYVVGSVLNDGFYRVSTVNELRLILDSDETLVAETADDDFEIDIYTVKIPPEIKLILADVIKVCIEEYKTNVGLKKQSESLGDYSYSLFTEIQGEYQSMFQDRLNRYRKMRK